MSTYNRRKNLADNKWQSDLFLITVGRIINLIYAGPIQTISFLHPIILFAYTNDDEYYDDCYNSCHYTCSYGCNSNVPGWYKSFSRRPCKIQLKTCDTRMLFLQWTYNTNRLPHIDSCVLYQIVFANEGIIWWSVTNLVVGHQMCGCILSEKKIIINFASTLQTWKYLIYMAYIAFLFMNNQQTTSPL